MDELENIYNKRFHDKELPNDDFDVDGLWDAVEAELDNDSGKGGKISYKYWPLGILMLLGVALSFYFYIGTDSDQYKNGSTTMAETNLTKENTEVNQIDKSNTSVKDQVNAMVDHTTFAENKPVKTTEKKLEKITDAKPLSAPISDKDKGQKQTFIDNNEITKINNPSAIKRPTDNSSQKETSQDKESTIEERQKQVENEQLSDAEYIAENTLSIKQPTKVAGNVNGKERTKARTEESSTANVFSTDKEKDNVTESNKSFTSEVNNNNTLTNGKNQVETTEGKGLAQTLDDKKELQESIEFSAISVLAIASLEMQTPNVEEQMVYDEEAMNEREITPVKKRNLTWEVEAYGGFNKLDADFVFQGDSLEQLNANYAEQGEYGSTYGIQIGLLWKKRWSLKVGAEYQTLWSQFDFESEQSQNIQKDTLQTVFFDPNSNTVVDSIYGIVNGTQSVARNVVHHNKYTMYSFPVTLGWQDNKERFVYGLDAGATFNFVRKQSGRLVNGEGIIEFTESENKAFVPFEAFHVGLRLTPHIGYRLTSRTTVKLMPQLNWYSNAGTSRVNGGIAVYGLNVGLGMRF